MCDSAKCSEFDNILRQLNAGLNPTCPNCPAHRVEESIATNDTCRLYPMIRVETIHDIPYIKDIDELPVGTLIYARKEDRMICIEPNHPLETEHTKAFAEYLKAVAKEISRLPGIKGEENHE